MPTRTTTRISVRLSPDELAVLAAEVDQGRAASRSDALHRAVAGIQRDQRYRAEERVLVDLARRGEPVHPDLAGLVSSVPSGRHGFHPFPRRGSAITNELIDRLREEGDE